MRVSYPKEEALRLQAYQEFIQSVDDRSLLDSIVTQYDPQRERPSMDWSSQSFPRHKKEIYFKGQKRK
jgi:hypothetical protein